MANCTYSGLRQKEVINLCNGSRLGFICDLEINLCDGRIETILVPGESGLLGFGRCEVIAVPWEKIETIGADAILVRAENISCCPPNGEEHRRKHPKWFG